MSRRICVMMSTYNGESFVEEQIRSLFSQQQVSISVVVRDDGSTDGTVALLEKLQGEFEFKLLVEKNCGVKRSFMRLLASADDAEYFAFCDQDDYWLKDKLCRAVLQLQSLGDVVPTMYCSAVSVVDRNLQKIRADLMPVDVGLGGLLVENFAVGCTVVINRSARDLVLRNSEANFCMHDWWVALLIKTYGKVVCDSESRILYRQHGGNSVGVQAGVFSRLMSGLQFMFSLEQKFDAYGQISAFQVVCKAESPDTGAHALALCQRIVRAKGSFLLRAKLLLAGDLAWKSGARSQVKKLHFLLFGIIR